MHNSNTCTSINRNSAYTPGSIGEEAGTVPQVADGEGRPRFIPRVARRAVERPPVVPRYITCPDAHQPDIGRGERNSAARARHHSNPSELPPRFGSKLLGISMG